MDPMDPTLAGVFYLVGVILFVLAAVAHFAGRRIGPLFLMALGLAFVWFVAMWNSFAVGS